MFVYHFVDLDLRDETFFEKNKAAENQGANFEMKDIGTSTYLHWLEENSMQSLPAFLLLFW